MDLFKTGALGTDTPGSMFVLCNSALDADYDTLQSPRGTDYQVTVGKTLYTAKLMFSNTFATGWFAFGYGDDVVGASATPPTNYVQLVEQIYATVAKVEYTMDIVLAVPATKYPCVFSTGGTLYINIQCIEI